MKNKINIEIKFKNKKKLSENEKNLKYHYENYIYPNNNEIQKIKINLMSKNLILYEHGFINSIVYKGKKKDFNNYNLLIVGCGTEILHRVFNEYCYYNNINIVAIGLSETSLKTSKLMLENMIDKLDENNIGENFNIKIIEMSLLDLQSDIHGKFDMIHCTGVLHHLVDPSSGLDKLYECLKDDGYMCLMVYGKMGRKLPNHITETMKIINKGIDTNDYETKIKNFKDFYYDENTNGYLYFQIISQLCGVDEQHMGDNGIVDQFLHSQEKDYDIIELFDFIEHSGLKIIEFINEENYKMNLNRNVNDIIDKSHLEKYKINELNSFIRKHSFFVTKKENNNTVLKIDELDNIMCTDFAQIYFRDELLKFKIYLKTDTKTDIIFFNEVIPKDPIIYHILNFMNGKDSIKEIFDKVRENMKINKSDNELLEIFKPIYYKLWNIKIIYLKAPLTEDNDEEVTYNK